MTTIAYKANIIAYDSRLTRDITIVDDNWNKKIEGNGSIFFMAGTPEDFEEFFELYFSDKVDKKHYRHLNVSCFVVEGENLFESYISHVGSDSDPRLYKVALDLWTPAAMGSGTDHALTAMDMGATAEEAVYMAAQRDCKTGGDMDF